MAKKSIGVVGIKELKDRASELLAAVERDGEEVVVTKNTRKIAKIIPFPERESVPRLEDLDSICSSPSIERKGRWKDLKLVKLNLDAELAIRTILFERDRN